MSYTGRLAVKNGVYQAIVNYKENGKYKQKWISTGLKEIGNKRKAEKFLREQLESFSVIKQKTDDMSSFIDLLDNWMEVKGITLRQNSYDIYERVLTHHIRPYFENLGLSIYELEAKHFQAYFTNKSKTLKRSTLDRHYTILHSSIEYAINTLELLSDNKVKRVVLPKKTKRIPSFYTEQEIRELFRRVQGELIETPVRLCAMYGLRRSEVLGLSWQVVDFDLNTITISHTAVRCGSEVIYDDVVKANSSYRTMPLSDSVKEYLLEVKAKQEENKKLFGNTYHKNNYICVWEDGKPIEPNFLTRKFRLFLKDNGFRHIRFHDLRHSSASLLINMGFTLKEVQEWLGHADIESTNIYAHLLYKSKENMAERVDEALNF